MGSVDLIASEGIPVGHEPADKRMEGIASAVMQTTLDQNQSERR